MLTTVGANLLLGFALQVAAPGLQPPQAIPMDSLATDARRVLAQRCSCCHGDQVQRAAFGSVLSIDGLVRAGVVIRGRPDDSPLIQRLAPVGDMPPRGDPIAEPERETLRRWIRAGAPALDAPSSAPLRAQITERSIVDVIRADLDAMPATDRPFARYFTLHHAHNQQLDGTSWAARRQELEDALLVLVNSLSWRRSLHRFQALASATVLRFDLRQVGWSAAQWGRVIRRYPYAARLAGQTREAIDEPMQLDEAVAVPCVRADWFVANASRGLLYDDLLGLPATRGELERRLEVDVPLNRQSFTAHRAGFIDSGVSHNNRVIERHDSPFGAYWQSFDFADNVGRHDVLRNPLGPGGAVGEFDPAGGEVIFNLPNGLQGYMLVDGRGRRIEDAPIAVVHDRTNERDPTIHNGLSCMACHGMLGVIPKRDIVATAVAHASLSEERRQQVLALYATGDAWSAQMEGDRARYEASLRQLLPTSGAGAINALPVIPVAEAYAQPLDASAAAAALDGTVDERRARIADSGARGRALLGPVVGGGRISRDVFECAWRELAAELDPSREFPREGGADLSACGGQAPAPSAPARSAATCAPTWRSVQTLPGEADAQEWAQTTACDTARRRLAAQATLACAIQGLTSSGTESTPCACSPRVTREGRAFWSCSVRGPVSCGQYDQNCATAQPYNR